MKGFWIKANGERVELAVQPSIEEAKRMVGGWIELSKGRDAEGASCQLLVNEEGHVIGLPLNVEATRIYRRACRPDIPADQLPVIVGDAVILYGRWRLS